jgi:hypothetical protein
MFNLWVNELTSQYDDFFLIYPDTLTHLLDKLVVRYLYQNLVRS